MNGYNRSYCHSLEFIKIEVILNGYSIITGVIGMPLVIPFRSWRSFSHLLVGNLPNHSLEKGEDVPKSPEDPQTRECFSRLLRAG